MVTRDWEQPLSIDSGLKDIYPPQSTYFFKVLASEGTLFAADYIVLNNFE